MRKFNKKRSLQKCRNYRLRILELSQKAKCALHIGGSFSCTEILGYYLIIFKNKERKAMFYFKQGSLINFAICYFRG